MMTAHQDALFEEPLHECTAYKSTKISDIVCQRNVRLYSNRLITLHPTNTSEKVWYLSSGCTLSPEYREEIQPRSFSIRPPGSWSVTTKAAALAGGSPPVELYCVTIHWPASWLATRGYTSFMLGFETAHEAAQWHSRVQRQVSNLRMHNVSSKGDASAGHSSKPSYDDRSWHWSSGGTPLMRKASQDKGFVASALEHWLGSRVDKPAAQDDSGVQAQPYRMPTSPVQIPIPSRPSTAPTSMLDADCGDEQGYGCVECDDPGAAGRDSAIHSTHAAAQDEQRWVPYRHTNGVAIYHQKQSKCSVWAGDEQGEGLGSEYMASSIVRGSPAECLAVLTDLSSNTTILGPASKIELLEGGDERQVLRITVEATGMARRLCAPRELIVERLCKREECGVDVVLFSSCDPPNVTPHSRRRNGLNASTASFASAVAGGSSSCSNSSSIAPGLSSFMLAGLGAAGAAAAGVAPQLLRLFAVGGSGGGLSMAVVLAMLLLVGMLLIWRSAHTSRSSKHPAAAGAAGKGWRAWASSVAAGGAVMWYKPVQAFVQGGYTISPREDCHGAYSPECLVTCILKVELAGWLGERSWLQPFADALGWVDAYVERMLMAVILVKDEVEQRRFLVQPFSILTSTSRTGLAGVPSPLTDAAVGMDDMTLDGGIGQQQRLMQRQWSSARCQQAGVPQSTSPLWQPQHRAQYVVEQQQQCLPQQGAVHICGEQQLGYKSSGSSTSEGQQKASGQKQKGRLGRMASRIYALRPRILRGSNSERAEAPTSPPVSALYKESISFNSHITARTVDVRGNPAAGDSTFTGSFHVPGAGGVDTSAAGGLDLTDPKVLLASAGLPPDTAVVQPEYYMGGPQGPAARGATLNSKFWQELHTPGTPAPFKLRGPSYLEDRQKVDGGMPQFVLGSVDLVETPGPTQHISRFLPQVRLNQAGYSFVVNLIIPGTPMLSLVAVFINEHHPDVLDPPHDSIGGSSSKLQSADRDQLGAGDMDTDAGSLTSGMSYSSSHAGSSSNGPVSHDTSRHGLKAAASNTLGPVASAASSSNVVNGNNMDMEACSEAAVVYERPADTSDWQPFDYALHRFLHGDDVARTAMFKLIPHIAEGSWVIKQSVGTVPVILGNKLKTVYYQTDRYIEACCDVTSSSAAAYITGMVRGATKSLVIDLGFVLEGQHSEELPEALLGAFRLNHLDCTTAQKIDTSKELPLLPRPVQHHQLVAMQQEAQQQLAATGVAPLAAAVEAANSGDTTVFNSRTPRGAAAAATAALASGALTTESSAQPTAGLPLVEPVQQSDAMQVQALALQLQQKIHRSSLSPLEGGRTMTGRHARSWSAASVDELMSASCSQHTAVSSGYKELSRPKTGDSLSAASPRQQQWPQDQHRQQQQGVSSTPRRSCHSESILSSQVSSQHPPSIKTAVLGQSAAAAASAGDGIAPGGKVSTFVNVAPAKQLFSNLLSFGGTEKSSGSRNSSAAAVAAADAVGGAGANSGGQHSYGAINALSSAATPAGTGASTPSAPAGGLLTSINSVGSVGARSGHSVATPTASAPVPVGLRGHHRTSSNSDCKTPAGAAAAGPGWPASPPTSGEWSSKLSAAAYISRAHAAALAASAQRRSGGRTSHQHSTSSPPTGCFNGADPASGASATAYLSVSPPNFVPAASLEAAECSGIDSWQTKRPRTSSSGTAVIHERRRQHESSSSSGADIFVLGAGQKITASEQLRLSKQQQQQSGAGYMSNWGSGVHHHASSSSGSSSLSVLANATGSRQSSTPGHVCEAYASTTHSGTPPAVAYPSQPQQQLQRKSSHRRFASLQINGVIE